jgi:hypothetical protein
MDIQYCGCCIYGRFSSNGAGRKLLTKCSLKLMYMVLNISFPCCGLHKLIRFNITEQLDIDRPSILVNPMITMGIILQNLL